MKYYFFYIIIGLSFILHSCTHNVKMENDLVNESIATCRLQSHKEVIFYRDSNNKSVKDTRNYKFLNAKQLLTKLDENFYTLEIKHGKNNSSVSFFSYKTGEYQIVKFDNKQEVIDIKKGISKPTPSKPFYIFYEIMKRKYPNYMDWNNFPIPEDSLK